MGNQACTPLTKRESVTRQFALLADAVEQIIVASAKVNALRGRPYLGPAVVGLIQVEALRASIR